MKTELQDHLWFMGLALEQADLGYRAQEVPVGAVLVSPTGEILSNQHNLKEANFNPTGHAEMLTLLEGSKRMQNWRLADCTLYVTLEPCPMCLAAMVQARLKLCVFGAYDSKGGSLSLGYLLNKDKRLNHQFSIMGGVRHFECSKILSQFFKERRTSYKPKN
ncbi:MAG TPA: nucleoside deaminase [Bacteriovoracaceae bacterium]|nr:nucleoside deaminase [Bacteriovoracaceae bacterium]